MNELTIGKKSTFSLDVVSRAILELMVTTTGKFDIDQSVFDIYAKSLIKDLDSNGLKSKDLAKALRSLKDNPWKGAIFGYLPPVFEIIKIALRPDLPGVTFKDRDYDSDHINFTMIDKGAYNLVLKKCTGCNREISAKVPKGYHVDIIKQSSIVCKKCRTINLVNKKEST